MAEYYFRTPSDQPKPWTFEFHFERERVNHWEQGHQRPRMEKALQFVETAILSYATDHEGPPYASIVDLGCGDGAMLEQIGLEFPEVGAWGYDFQPSNVEGWVDRRIQAQVVDVFNDAWSPDAPAPWIDWAPIAIVTEVLEHLRDPHGAIRWMRKNGVKYIVASSPWQEEPANHDACHVWGWDQYGYRMMFARNGYNIIRHELVDWSQVVLAEVLP